MISSVLKLAAGASGSWLIYGVLAALAGLGGFAGVQTWRLHTAQANLSIAQSNLKVEQANNITLQAGITQANKDADATRAAAVQHSQADADRARRLLKLKQKPTIAAPGANSLNEWLKTQ